MEENEECSSWFSCVCKSGETLFFFNALTGEHRWTDKSLIVHYSRVSSDELPPASGDIDDLREITLKIFQKHGEIPHSLGKIACSKTFADIDTETERHYVEPKPETRTVETQTYLEDFTSNESEESGKANVCTIESTNTESVEESYLSSGTEEEIQEKTFAQSAASKNAKTKKELFISETSASVVEVESEHPLTSPYYQINDPSSRMPEADSCELLAASHNSIIDNLFAMNSCFSPVQTKTEMEEEEEKQLGAQSIEDHDSNVSSPIEERTKSMRGFSNHFKVKSDRNFESSTSNESHPIQSRESVDLFRKPEHENGNNGNDSELGSVSNNEGGNVSIPSPSFMVKSVEGAIYIEGSTARGSSYTANKISVDELPSTLESKDVQERVYSCPDCCKEFQNAKNLTRHYTVHLGEKHYPCPDCSKAFRDKASLKKHMRTHTGERPYQCNVCGKSFSQSQNLNKHINTHTGHRPYKCPTCGKAFTQHSHLARHVRIHTGEKPYACVECRMNYRTSSQLARHKKGKRHALMVEALSKKDLRSVENQASEELPNGNGVVSLLDTGEAYSNENHMVLYNNDASAMSNDCEQMSYAENGYDFESMENEDEEENLQELGMTVQDQ